MASAKTPPPVQPREALRSTDVPALTAAIDARQDQFLALLGSPEAVARFRTVALHAVSARPDLLRCEPLTIIEAIREAASLDLEPTGILGEAWLVPYKGMARLRIGWQGYLKLIRRSGEVAAVDCQVVYQGDIFDLQLGTTPGIHHVPALKDRGSYRGAYAWARLNDGSLIIEWLPVEDVQPIRAIAAADSLMWSQFAGEGMRKSAIRRLQKRLPKSHLVEHALRVESEAEEVPASQPAPARNAAMAALEARFDQVDVETAKAHPVGVESRAELLPEAEQTAEDMTDEELERLTEGIEQPDDATIARVMGNAGRLDEE
jgi:phage RecT family recombinase